MAEICNCSNTMEGSVFQKVAYIPVFTAGLLLNGFAVYIFLRGRSGWTETHVYTFSLAVANCALLLFLPVRTYDAFRRLAPDTFCTFLVSTHYLNMYVSIFTRTAISVHRCVAVNFPMRRRAWGLQKPVAGAVCALIWAVAVALSAAFNWNSAGSLNCCYERKWEPLRNGLFELLVVVGFFIPLGVITACTVRTVFCVLRCSRATGVVSIMTVNLVVFATCYSPIHWAFFLKFRATSCSSLVYSFYHVSEWMATTNCCWDALAYYFLFKKFFYI
uniref:G-protein coupled receptors family 1 profile domain-containing protein n=1 Tax=Scleropages formosus TaxID=113540 RepID=A0A8C9W1Y7_SCLFO